MCTTVKRELIWQLIAKVVHGVLITFFLYTSVMFWPLTITAAARLTAPFVVLVLSSIFLREYASKTTLLLLVLTLSGASMIVFSSPISEEDYARIAALGSASFMAYVFLFGEPFLTGVGQVLMRGLRQLSNKTVSCYTNLASMLVFLVWILISGDDILYFQVFGVYDWLALISASVLLVIA